MNNRATCGGCFFNIIFYTGAFSCARFLQAAKRAYEDALLHAKQSSVDPAENKDVQDALAAYKKG